MLSFVVVQSLSHVLLFATPETTAHQPSLAYTSELAHTHVHWVSDAIRPSHPLSSSSPAFSAFFSGTEMGGAFVCANQILCSTRMNHPGGQRCKPGWLSWSRRCSCLARESRISLSYSDVLSNCCALSFTVKVVEVVVALFLLFSTHSKSEWLCFLSRL